MKRSILIAGLVLCLAPALAQGAINSLVVSAVSHQQIDLNWNAYPGAAQYTIHRAVGTSIVPGDANRVTAVALTYEHDLGLTAATYYTYVVIARNSSGVELDRSPARTAATLGTQIESYAYDRAGNRPQRLLNRGTQTYRYDAAGNITGWSRGTQNQANLYYDAANRLARVQLSGIDEEYIYDASGERVARKAGGVVVERYFAAGVRRDGLGDSLYYMAGDRRVALRDPQGNLNYFHYDHLQSTTLISDESGSDTPAMKAAYQPFGQPRELSGALAEPYLFGGKYYHRGMGISFFESRYYWAELGRFLQPDTVIPDLADPQRNNRYAFAANDPLNRADPSGHFDMYMCYGPGCGGWQWGGGSSSGFWSLFGFSGGGALGWALNMLAINVSGNGIGLLNNLAADFDGDGAAQDGPRQAPPDPAYIVTMSAVETIDQAHTAREGYIYRAVNGIYLFPGDATNPYRAAAANGDDVICSYGTGKILRPFIILSLGAGASTYGSLGANGMLGTGTAAFTGTARALGVMDKAYGYINDLNGAVEARREGNTAGQVMRSTSISLRFFRQVMPINLRSGLRVPANLLQQALGHANEIQKTLYNSANQNVSPGNFGQPEPAIILTSFNPVLDQQVAVGYRRGIAIVQWDATYHTAKVVQYSVDFEPAIYAVKYPWH